MRNGRGKTKGMTVGIKGRNQQHKETRKRIMAIDKRERERKVGPRIGRLVEEG